jgi:ABC-type branched-subunit amino acid transport system substrate-binding protein/TolA-binding protein
MAIIMSNVRLLGSNHGYQINRYRLVVACVSGALVCSLLAGCGIVRSSGPSSARTPDAIAPKPVTMDQRREFAVAETLYNEGRDQEALKALQNFVQRYPFSSLTDQALMALGTLSLKLEQPIQAQGYYQHLTQRFPASPLAPEANLKLGIVSHDLKHYDASTTALNLALERLTLPPQRAQAYYYIGLNMRALQRYVEAFEAFNRVVDAGPDTALVQEAQSAMNTLMQNHLTPEDVRQLASRYTTEPEGAQLLLRLAQSYRATGDTTGELGVLQQLINTYPKHPELPALTIRLQALQSALVTDASKIGVLLPLSGEGKLAGERVRWGIELALEVLRDEQPGLEIKLDIRDCQGNSEVASRALRSLVTDAHVIAVIGPLFSQVATDLAPLVEELGVPVISPYARDSTFPFLSSYAFRNSLTDVDQARFLADYAVRVLHLRRFAVLYPDEPYGESFKDTFIEYVIGLDGQVVAVSAYPPDDKNFSQAIKRLGGIDDESLSDILAGSGTKVTMNNSKPYEAIFLPGYYDRVGLIAPELAFYNITHVQLLGTDGWNSQELTAIGEQFVEGAIFVDGFFADATTASVETFVERFVSRYQERPTLFAAQGYDTLRIVVQLLQAGASTRLELRDKLLQLVDFPGVTGLTSMDADGNAIKIPYLLSVRNGRIVQLN